MNFRKTVHLGKISIPTIFVVAALVGVVAVAAFSFFTITQIESLLEIASNSIRNRIA